MLTRILGIKTSDRPPVHLYALPPAQVRRFLGDGDRVEFRISPAGGTILMSNTRESDSDYSVAYYYGYTAALLASDGRLSGPYWYQTGLPLVFATRNTVEIVRSSARSRSDTPSRLARAVR